LTEFASLLGTSKPEGSSKAMLSLLTDASQDHAVVLTLPSLDLGSSEAPTTGFSHSPLPTIGEQPTMAASVLASATTPEGATSAQTPDIGKLTSWTKSTLEYAPDAVQKNLSLSFASLVESRIRAWTLLLLRQSLAVGDNESRARLLRMLSSTVTVVSAETNFKTLSLPATQTEGNVMVLPLLLEVILRVSVQDKEENVVLRAPGTVSGKHLKLHLELKPFVIPSRGFTNISCLFFFFCSAL
jgi:hypothetical protein